MLIFCVKINMAIHNNILMKKSAWPSSWFFRKNQHGNPCWFFGEKSTLPSMLIFLMKKSAWQSMLIFWWKNQHDLPSWFFRKNQHCHPCLFFGYNQHCHQCRFFDEKINMAIHVNFLMKKSAWPSMLIF